MTYGSTVQTTIATGSEVLQAPSMGASIQGNNASSPRSFSSTVQINVAPSQAALIAQIQAFQQEQRSLAASLKALIAEGATRQQLQEWRQQNVSRSQTQRQRAQAVSMIQALQPLFVARQANIPQNASSALKDFITGQASLGKAQAEIHNQLLKNLPVNPDIEAVNQMFRQERQVVFQEHAGNLQTQSQRAQSLTQLSASVPFKISRSPVIPLGASPQMQAYLTARGEFSAGCIQIWNQYLSTSPQARRVAMQQWRQRNAVTIKQLRQMAVNMATPAMSD